MMLIAVLYQLFLVVGYPILLGGLKMGDEVLEQSVLGDIFIGHGGNVKFISYVSHE